MLNRSPGDHSLLLPSGRAVGYAVYGDPDGAVVVNCHGGLVSGHDVAPADEVARRLGLCVVSPDRPGINRTDRLRGHGVLPWVRTDLVPLLDHLGVATLGVMGWSEGGQYALGAAVGLEGRVTGCAVIAGCPPLDDPVTLAESNTVDRVLAALARRAPTALRCTAACTRQLARRAPGVLLRAAVHGQPAPESRAVVALDRWFPTLLAEGSADTRGVVEEYLAAVAPWGFSPEEVTGPVAVFQGTADPTVPESWGRVLADRIPGAALTLFPGEGHFIALTRRREVLEWLATTMGGAGRR